MAKNNMALKITKLNNSAAKAIQKMVNKANQTTLEFNQKEANTARAFNSREAQIARDFNKQEAAISRDWQEKMSNTSHQREVSDLKAAGLNPVLSANSGANSYTTSSANASNASGSGASASLDSGAGALGSIYGSLMSAMSGMKQTQMQNDASLRIARLNNEATHYAADKNAASAAYVASQNRAASEYSANMAYKTQMDKPQSGVASLIDKYFGSTLSNFATSINDQLIEGKDYAFKENGNFKFINFKSGSLLGQWLGKDLNMRAELAINALNNVAGFDKNSSAAYNLILKAIKGNPLSIKKLNYYTNIIKRKYK